MKYLLLPLIIIALSAGNNSFAQQAKIAEDFKPSEVNQLGKLYPQVNSERCVRASISAPQANKV